MQAIPLTILSLQDDGYHCIVEVNILDQTFHMVLDTGASKTVLDRNTLLEYGVSEDSLINTNILSTGLGTNTMESHYLELQQISMGDWQQRRIKVAVLDLSTINFAYEQMNLPKVVGVLGGDILLQYGAIINYKKKTLHLNKRKIKSIID